MDSDSKRLQPEFNDEQWLLIANLFPDKPVVPKVAAQLRSRVTALNAFSGCCEAVLNGKTCHLAFLLASIVGVVLHDG